MNNILELCKIFNCKLNDLVHTDMTDITSLDEEIVMNVVKFNEKKQKEVKTLSNVISLIGKIGAIAVSYTHLDVYKRQLPVCVEDTLKISQTDGVIRPRWRS